MAMTMQAALLEVEDQLLDSVNRCTLVSYPVPCPSTGTTVELRRVIENVTDALRRKTPVGRDEAYEAVFDAFVLLGERNGERFWSEPVGDWHPLLLFWAKLAVKKRRSEWRRAQLILGRALELGERSNAEKTLEPDGESLGIAIAPLERKPGGPWGRGEIVHAFLAFENKRGRPPLNRDVIQSKVLPNGDKELPDSTAIRREFGNIGAARVAAGQPEGVSGHKQKKWTKRTLAEFLSAYAARAGCWPDSDELEFRVELPARTTIQRYFGTTAMGRLQAAVEAELADPDGGDGDDVSRLPSEVAVLIPTQSWEEMDEEQRDSFIENVVLPRYMETTKDGLKLGPKFWGDAIGTTKDAIGCRIHRLRQKEAELVKPL